MKTFEIKVTITAEAYMHIDAESEEEARGMVHEEFDWEEYCPEYNLDIDYVEYLYDVDEDGNKIEED